MIAAAARSCTRCVSCISMSVSPAAGERPRVLSGKCSGNAAGLLLHVRAGRLVRVGVGDHVGKCAAPPGRSTLWPP